jgi:hypothetical protein
MWKLIYKLYCRRKFITDVMLEFRSTYLYGTEYCFDNSQKFLIDNLWGKAAGAWGWPLISNLTPRSRIRGSIHPLPHTSSWRSAWLVKHRDNFTLFLTVYENLWWSFTEKLVNLTQIFHMGFRILFFQLWRHESAMWLAALSVKRQYESSCRDSLKFHMSVHFFWAHAVSIPTHPRQNYFQSYYFK